MNKEERKEFIVKSIKDKYETKFAWFPRKVYTVEYFGFSSGNCNYKWIWLEPYNYYNGKSLDLNYVLHLSLPDDVWFSGIEHNPFLKF